MRRGVWEGGRRRRRWEENMRGRFGGEAKRDVMGRRKGQKVRMESEKKKGHTWGLMAEGRARGAKTKRGCCSIPVQMFPSLLLLFSRQLGGETPLGRGLERDCRAVRHSESCRLHVLTERLDTRPSCWDPDRINPPGACRSTTHMQMSRRKDAVGYVEGKT